VRDALRQAPAAAVLVVVVWLFLDFMKGAVLPALDRNSAAMNDLCGTVRELRAVVSAKEGSRARSE